MCEHFAGILPAWLMKKNCWFILLVFKNRIDPSKAGFGNNRSRSLYCEK